MVVSKRYCPDRGDLVWLSFSPQAGSEQAGRRPALVISPKAYNLKVGLILACPVTTSIKNYPFEVKLPDGLSLAGVILSDQIKSLDWNARNAELACRVLPETVDEVLAKISTLLS
ncbi:MAG: endoribonuclease MazF [Candidatus Aminicenantes bacterium]|nr:endoribonuclease MazF [Candidatus Aminicenantes bacterium]